jgi:hypothetical protein
VARTLARLAHSLGLAGERDAVAEAGELVAGFDPDRLPRGPVTL